MGMEEDDRTVLQSRFLELFLANQHYVYSFIASIVPHWVEADDIFQQTCLTLWERWEQFDPEKNFAFWACGIAMNHLQNHMRKKQNRQAMFERHLLEQIAICHVEERVLLEELQERLRECLGKLSANHRHILMQYYDGQASPKAIAEAEGKTSNAIYKLLRKIRSVLYDCVTQDSAKWQAS